jgi:hypothetical protein
MEGATSALSKQINMKSLVVVVVVYSVDGHGFDIANRYYNILSVSVDP